MAPELLKGSRADYAVDWWSLGILVYEFIYGTSPFHTGKKLPFAMQEKILHSGKITFPENINVSFACKEFITLLLRRNPNERLGNKGADEVLQHTWMKAVEFDDDLLLTKKVFSYGKH